LKTDLVKEIPRQLLGDRATAAKITESQDPESGARNAEWIKA